MTGIVLVGITANPPVTLLDWIQILGGAALTASITTYEGRRWICRLKLPVRLLRWLRRRRVALAIAVALTVALVYAIPPAWKAARGVAISIGGCAPATQLRMLASAETATSARQLASAFERWTAGENHRCPTVDVYVSSAPTAEISKWLGHRWADESGALREIGPRPDVWLAATSHEVADVTAAIQEFESADATMPIADSTPIARSPVVLAVPEAVWNPATGADRDTDEQWPALFRRLTDRGVAVIRADPDVTELGQLANALLYADEEPGLAPAEVERRIAASQAGFPLTDSVGLLCRHRQLGSRAAVVTTEQNVVQYNLGDPLGPLCRSRADVQERLVAVYPSDTRELDHQLVRLGWSAPPQVQAAAQLARWLDSDPGRAAIVSTGLRPVDPYPMAAAPGIDSRPRPVLPPLPQAVLEQAKTAFDAAQERGRVLFAIDTSGSMAATNAVETRWAAAAAAVEVSLGDAGQGDEFGLWFFPGGADTGHVEAVPLGPADEPRLTAARQALGSRVPAGNTPLYRTIIAAAAALPSEAGQVEAIVVLTDGEDTNSGVNVEAVGAALADSGVRLIVVTIGGLRCASTGLATVTETTGGECLDADVADVSTVLRTATRGLWGG